MDKYGKGINTITLRRELTMSHEEIEKMKAIMVSYYKDRPEMLKAFHEGHASGLANADMGEVIVPLQIKKVEISDPMVEMKKEWYATI